MPQITCPNCGTTINLENRKKIDFDLVLSAVKRGPQKFTDLLKATRLSRKTLSLRLKEMCESGVLVKLDGKYDLNRLEQPHGEVESGGRGLTRLLGSRRMRVGLALISLVLLSSASGYAVAVYVAGSGPKQIIYSPVVLGNVTLALDVHDIKDLYAWQVVVSYNSSELLVLNTAPGDFFQSQFFARSMVNVSSSLFLNKTMDAGGALLLGGSLIGPVAGVNGTGRLALITFAVFAKPYSQPTLVSNSQNFDTFLLSSDLSTIPWNNSTLNLTIVEQH
jgi:DNA-binding Lrp family transcriptional regulator